MRCCCAGRDKKVDDLLFIVRVLICALGFCLWLLSHVFCMCFGFFLFLSYFVYNRNWF